MSEDRWLIQGVFDPTSGVDFAYTVGLAGLAGVELHLWCQPTFGADPGDGFRFSHSDMARLLNVRAAAVVDGGAVVDDEFEMTFDAGLTRVRFVPRRVRAFEVDAFAVGDAPVVTLDWELSRRTVPVDETHASSVLGQLVASFPHDQGSMVVAEDRDVSPLVERWAELISGFDPPMVAELLELSVPSASQVSAALGVVAAVARATGRESRLGDARERAGELANRFASELSPDWGPAPYGFAVAAPVTGAAVLDVLDQVPLVDWTAEDLERFLFAPVNVVLDPDGAHDRAMEDPRVAATVDQVLAAPASTLTGVVDALSADPDLVRECVRVRSQAVLRTGAVLDPDRVAADFAFPLVVEPVAAVLAAALTGLLVGEWSLLTRMGVHPGG